jgi:hypothetical protein
MTVAVGQLTFRATLTKQAKKEITLSPAVVGAIKESMRERKDVVVYADGETFLVRPQHPVVEGAKGYDDWESVYIMLITGFTSYKVPKGAL